mmetsp:Transcript_8862/g.8245  ORF Transcript_8862/g.8245 Transcript_8862/m.8245 type:complete len:80 (+) Transcript_8862:1074-1313(+)
MICQNQDANEVGELYELKIAEKYLKSPFFERRVRGINDLKDIFYKVKNTQTMSKHQLEHQNVEYAKWLNFERYANWLIE